MENEIKQEVASTETSNQEEKKYTQSDLDNIVNKVKESTKSKMIDPKEYDKVVQAYEELRKEKALGEVRKAFEEFGGNNSYFEDFIKLNPNIDTKNIKTQMEKSPWVYNNNGLNEKTQKTLSQIDQYLGQTNPSVENMSLYEYAQHLERNKK